MAPSLLLSFENAKASDLLDLYQTLIPEDLIRDSAIDSVGRPVSVKTRNEVTRDHAIALIEMALMLNGYTLVQADPGIVKVLGPSTFPRGQGLPVYRTAEELPKGERVISFFMSLQNLTPADAVELLSALISPPKSYTGFFVVPNANAVIITESTSVVRELIKLQALFDVPPAQDNQQKLKEWARERRARTDLQVIGGQIDTYKARHGALPKNLDYLVERPQNSPEGWKQLLQRAALDPWGEFYIYRTEPKANGVEFVLVCKGPDRKEGTSDDFVRKSYSE
jgi:type II secretory pathway component GspD/PulD (secretin)